MKSVLMGSLLAAWVVSPAFGVIIPVNDDTQIQEDAPDSAFGPAVTLVAQSSVDVTDFAPFRPAYKQPLMEFTIGNTAATSANLTMTVVTARGAFNGNLYAAPYEFSEDTLTWTGFWGANDGTDASLNGVSPANWANDPVNTQTPYDTVLNWSRLSTNIAVLGATAGTHSIDVTAFYNAHLGQTVTFAIWEWQPINNNAVSWQSKQNTGGLGPVLDVVEVPEPTALLLLAMGGWMLPLRRRRRA